MNRQESVCHLAFKQFSLEHREAVIPGGESGACGALCLGLAEAGADIITSSRELDRIAVVAREIKQCCSRTTCASRDATDRNSLESLSERAVSAFGKVNILVNRALEMVGADWNTILETSFNDTFHACQVLKPAQAYQLQPFKE
jgi:NADP-dependent 3-hydroxy acid dehydrogenase YdfG